MNECIIQQLYDVITMTLSVWKLSLCSFFGVLSGDIRNEEGGV